MTKGVVIKSTGSWYDVRLENGEIQKCRIRGRFKLKNLRLTNPVAVGDDVMVEKEKNSESSVIKTILPRRNYIIRQSPRRRLDQHLIACNVDQAMIIMTIREPNLKVGFIDRFLLLTEPFNIPAIIVFNKADIYDEEDMEVYKALEHIYTKIGYTVLLISALEGEGIDPLKAVLKDKTTLVSGHSGVGKSTLVNQIDPTVELKTQEISYFSGKGQHTTTFAEMYPLEFGGQIIDTPGIKSLSFINMEEQDIVHNFREFFEYSKGCKYQNCMHLQEPKCAVKQAIEEGEISQIRYENYIKILEDTRNQNYWERQE